MKTMAQRLREAMGDAAEPLEPDAAPETDVSADDDAGDAFPEPAHPVWASAHGEAPVRYEYVAPAVEALARIAGGRIPLPVTWIRRGFQASDGERYFLYRGDDEGAYVSDLTGLDRNDAEVLFQRLGTGPAAPAEEATTDATA